jgi:hypothetical protein
MIGYCLQFKNNPMNTENIEKMSGTGCWPKSEKVLRPGGLILTQKC